MEYQEMMDAITEALEIEEVEVVATILKEHEKPAETRGRQPSLKDEDEIMIVEYADKRGGAAKARWDAAQIKSLVGETVTVESLLERGLTRGDINHELKVRGNWTLVE